MIGRIRLKLAALTPAQASICAALFIVSLTLALIALWGFTWWNRRSLTA